MAPLSQDFILRKEHAVDATHKAASLAVQIRIDLFLERRLVEVTRANCYTQSYSFLFRFTSNVLVNGDRRVNTPSLFEQRPDSTS